MNTEELGQLVGLLGKRAGEVKSPRGLPDSEIEQLIQAAALIGNGRAAGRTDEQIIGQFARKLLRERDKRIGAIDYRAEQAEKDLIARGEAADDIPVKNRGEMLADEAVFGFADQLDAAAAEDGEFKVDRAEGMRKGLRKARKIKNKQRRQAVIEKIEGRMNEAASEQKVFDFGLIPIVNENEDPINPRERGRLVRRGDKVFFEQGNQRVAWDGQRDERGEPILPDGIRMNPDVPVMMSDSEAQMLAGKDRAMAQSAVREFERRERGEFNTAEMEQMARRAAGKFADNEPFLDKEPVAGARRPKVQGPKQLKSRLNERGVREEFLVALPINEEGFRVAPVDEPNKEEFDVREQKAIGRRGIPGQEAPSLDEAQAAILGQLKARRDNNPAGRRRDAQIRNLLDALDEANQNLVDNRFPGPAGVAPGQNVREGRVEFGGIDAPNVGYVNDVAIGGGGPQNALGQLKGDKNRADMGLVIGDQKAAPQNAIRVQRTDGSFEYVDRAGNPLARPTEKAAQTVNMAEFLNAPDGAQNAFDFVEKNAFEDRGAQFFGDESIIAQMNDKGAGGGIEQVDIQGAMANLQAKVEKKLGGKKPPIKNVKDLQAAMNAVIANEQAKGRALINIVDGQKVKNPNPGIEEAMLALKMSPADQRQVANALKQMELAVNDPVVDSGAKFAGHSVVPGVNDPARGGDRLEIAKDIGFQGKLQRAGIGGEAAKPFIGLQAGDPRRVGDIQAYQGMQGDQVREFMENRQRENREKRIAALAKKGKGFKPDRIGEIAEIRRMQEGNAFARIRADRAAAEARAQGRNELGRLIEGTPVPSNLAPASGQVGRARPPRPRPQLQERPAYPPAPRTPEMDYMTSPAGPEDMGARDRRQVIDRITRQT